MCYRTCKEIQTVQSAMVDVFFQLESLSQEEHPRRYVLFLIDL